MSNDQPHSEETASLDEWRLSLSEPIDIAVLAYFRVAFGAIAAWEIWRFLDPSHDWVEKWYSGKEFYFSYWPFTFVQPLPQPWIQVAFWLTGVAAVMVAVGLFYRIAATALFVGLTYIFMLDQSRYLNHFYLILLISFLMIWLPVTGAASIDARRRPSIRSDTAPIWALWLLRFQIAVPYFFGGVAKLNSDWLQAEPMRAWLAERTTFPLIGRFFVDEPVVWTMTYGALFFDLFVVVGLLNRRTRPWAFLAAIVFHLMNSRLFGIGVFPWIMMAATLVFFDPSWPRLLMADLRGGGHPTTARMRGFYLGACVGFLGGGFVPETFSPWKAGIALVSVGVLGYDLGDLISSRRAARRTAASDAPRAADAEGGGEPGPESDVEGVGGGEPGPESGVEGVGGGEPGPESDAESAPVVDPAAVVDGESAPSRGQPAMLSVAGLVLLALWVAVQVLVPLRHLAIPGNVHWTEEGHNFSWHMKLRDKSSTARFFVTVDGQENEVQIEGHLDDQQISKMASRPHMIVEYAHYIEGRFEDLGFEDIEVRAEVYSSLNGREEQLLVDPTFDLTTQGEFWWGHAEWILPLQEPLVESASGGDG